MKGNKSGASIVLLIRYEMRSMFMSVFRETEVGRLNKKQMGEQSWDKWNILSRYSVKERKLFCNLSTEF